MILTHIVEPLFFIFRLPHLLKSQQTDQTNSEKWSGPDQTSAPLLPIRQQGDGGDPCQKRRLRRSQLHQDLRVTQKMNHLRAG